MAAHGMNVALPTHPTSGPASKDYMAHFNGHFDNLAAAAKNSGAALDHLAATTTTQYTEIKTPLAVLKTASNRTSRPSSFVADGATDSTPSIPPTDSKRSISQLEAAVRKNWHRGAFCFTHVWGVNKNHTSENFRVKKSGHVSTATHAHPTGPGGVTNKGWENFLSTRRVLVKSVCSARDLG